MKKGSEIAVVMVCMLAMFGSGLFLGGDNITYTIDRDNESEFNYRYVNYTGTFHRGPYEFRFMEKIEVEEYENTSIIVNGQALEEKGQKVIKLRTDRSAQEIHQTCNHEVLHHYFPQYKHPNFKIPGVTKENDPIYELEDKVDLTVCDDVTTEALQR